MLRLPKFAAVIIAAIAGVVIAIIAGDTDVGVTVAGDTDVGDTVTIVATTYVIIGITMDMVGP